MTRRNVRDTIVLYTASKVYGRGAYLMILNVYFDSYSRPNVASARFIAI